MMPVLTVALLVASHCGCVPAPPSAEARGVMEVRAHYTLKASKTEGLIVNGPNDEPESGVLVELLDSAGNRERAVITKDDGCFEFPKARSGKRTVRISKDGYDTYYYILDVSPSNRETQVHLPIRPSS